MYKINFVGTLFFTTCMFRAFLFKNLANYKLLQLIN